MGASKPFLKKNALIAAKWETTEGVDPTPTVSDIDAVVYDVSFKVEPTVIERNIVGGSFARKASLITLPLARVSFKIDVQGSGTGETAANWAKLLVACGFKSTTDVGAHHIDYDPVTTPAFDSGGSLLNGGGSLTLYVYEEGILKRAHGCRGTLKISGESGGRATMEWEFLGRAGTWSDCTDYPSLASEPATIPPICESAQFEIHSMSTLLIRSFTIDIGNTLGTRSDVNSVGGIKGVIIGDRKVTAQLDPETEYPSTFNPWASFLAGTRGTFSVNIGTATGNIVQIMTPSSAAQIVGIDEADRDGISANTIDLEFTLPIIESATQKEIRIIHR